MYEVLRELPFNWYLYKIYKGNGNILDVYDIKLDQIIDSIKLFSCKKITKIKSFGSFVFIVGQTKLVLL
jgi:hypothetical protein